MKIIFLNNRCEMILRYANRIILLAMLISLTYIILIHNSIVGRSMLVLLSLMFFLINRYKYLFTGKMQGSIEHGRLKVGAKEIDLRMKNYKARVLLYGWNGESDYSSRKRMRATGYGNVFEVKYGGRVVRLNFYLDNPMDEKRLIEELSDLDILIERM